MRVIWLLAGLKVNHWQLAILLLICCVANFSFCILIIAGQSLLHLCGFWLIACRVFAVCWLSKTVALAGPTRAQRWLGKLEVGYTNR